MPPGKKIKMYYDPRGNLIRTVNPDNSEQWVVYGKPNTLSSIAVNNSWSFKNYEPSPWESYTYDADDLASLTNGTSYGHDFTPKSTIVDALGRTVKTVDRLSQSSSDDVVMKQTYDIQGNVLTTVDALNRIVFRHKYGLAKQLLWKNHLDSGISTAIADATGKPIEADDAKGARVFTGYDVISRPLNVWAKDNSSGITTLRQVNVYAETLGIPVAAGLNLLGQIYQAYDEAGLTQMVECDFKGNPLEKFKQVISDDELVTAGTNVYTVDWTGLNTSILDSTEYRTTVEYDALNRGTKLTLPADITTHRAIIEPVFNNAGALEKIKKDGTEYVKQIAYNAKGQQILAAWNNDVMIRFAYDKKTFRLKRVKAEKYTYSQSGNTQTYAYNSGTTRYDQAYQYDLIGNVLAVSDQTPDCGLSGQPDQLSKLFEYDALYRLLQATGREENNVNNQYWTNPPQAGTPNANNCRAYTQQYEYDKVGNIQNLIHTASGNNWTRHYNYQANNNKLNSIDDGQGSPTTLASYTYDNAGNQTNCNADRKYIWGATNQLVAFIRQAGTSEPSVYAQYLYDATGNRVKKVVRKQGGVVETVTYIDGIFEYHTKVTTSTSEEKNYTLIQGGIEKRTGSFSGDGSEELIYTISDYLSSAVIRLTDNGSILDKEEYYPYGDTSLRTFGKKRYRFTGKERDDESGLYYYGARYYEAWSGKFLSIDPMIAKTPALSPYCYANGNPLVFNDPSGMEGEQQTNNSGGGSSSGSDNISNYTPDTVQGATPKEGDTYTDKGGNQFLYDSKVGSWTSKEVIVTATKESTTEPINEAIKDELKGKTIKSVGKIGEKLVAQSEKNAEKLKNEGKLVGTNGKVYNSPGLTKAGVPKNVANASFTTKGIDAAKTHQLLGWKNVIGRGLRVVTSLSDLPVGGMSVMSLADYGISKDPFVLLPTSFLTDIASDQWDQFELDSFDAVIKQGYGATKSYLQGAQRNPNNKAVQGLELLEVSKNVFISAMNGDYKDINSLKDATYQSNDIKNFAVLVKQIDAGKGQTTLKILASFNKN